MLRMTQAVLKDHYFSGDEVECCSKFANSRSYGTGLYEHRGFVDANKVRHDIFVGKLAEIAANRALSRIGLALTPPDFNIYPPDQKKFGPDLVELNYNTPVHVKGCDVNSFIVEKAQSLTWTFNYGERGRLGGRDFAFFGTGAAYSNDVICLTAVDAKELKGYISYMLYVRTLHRLNLFTLPLLRAKHDTKRVVYDVRYDEDGLCRNCLRYHLSSRVERGLNFRKES